MDYTGLDDSDRWYSLAEHKLKAAKDLCQEFEITNDKWITELEDKIVQEKLAKISVDMNTLQRNSDMC